MSMEERRQRIREELSRSWILRLNSFYDVLLNGLKLPGRPPRPTITLSESRTHWGVWRPDTRQIDLNVRLLLDHDSDTIRGILGHETAHHIVDDLHPELSRTQPPHGQQFQKICRDMGLHRAYWQASINLTENGRPPSPFHTGVEAPDNPLLEKIKKLLALSHSPEPHEAAAALAKAGDLMARHNIDTSRVMPDDPDSGAKCWRISTGSPILSKRCLIIATIIQNHFFASTVFCKKHDFKTDKPIIFLDLIGRPANLPMAIHVFHFLMERTESLWNHHKPMAAARGEKGRGAKTNFMAAMLRAFYQKLDDAEKIRVQNSRRAGREEPTSELILRSDAAVDRLQKELYPPQGTTTSKVRASRSSTRSPYSTAAGRQAGENLSVRSPLASSGGSGNGIAGHLT
ncbi:MAG: DUF2786 domain-containing protein [Deltaproteobacteria bacterium]|nr:DUF2786 domain-containing protein [Deltaproteobacteria bacterium]